MDGHIHIAMQRSRGAARVQFARRGAQTRLVDLHQSGSAKVMLPGLRSQNQGPVPEAVFLNTSGGLTGGDRLAFALELGEGARVLATTQTAERAYAATEGAAEIQISARVSNGGHLDWMPQETILYQNAHLIRHSQIDLGEGASCLLSESVVLGRHAMGEVVTQARLFDHRMICRAGRPVWADTMELGPETLAPPQPSPALLGGARAFAVVCLVAQGAEDAVATLRAAAPEAAVSGWDGKCVLRLAAADGWPLKQALAQVLHILTRRPLPRVWQAGEMR